MKKLFKKIMVIIFLYSVLFAQNTTMNFLEISPTAKQDATSTTSAFYNEIGCLFSNPAVLKNIKEKQFCFTHNEMFQQIKSNFISYVLPKEKYVLSLGIFGVYTTGIEGRSGEKDLSDEYVNIYQITQPEFYYYVYSVATGFGISKKIKDNVNIGATGKFLYEKIESVVGYSFATDIGAQIVKNNLWWFNIAVQNFGLPVRYTDRWWMLPTKFLFGLGYKYKNMNLYSEISFPWFNTKNLYFAVGVEPTFFDSLIFLRFGYKYKPYGWYLEDQYTGLSCGLGINYFGLQLDYSISSYGILGFVHKISLNLKLDKISKFYKLFREKIFSKKNVVEKIIIEDKITKETKKVDTIIPKKIEENKKPVIGEKVMQQTQEYNQTKVLLMKTNLKNVDVINKIFVYELVCSTESVEVIDNIIVKELKINIISKEVLPTEINYDVYGSTQYIQQQVIKQVDFSKSLYGVNVRNFDLQIKTKNPNLVIYNSKNGQNIEILSEKIVEEDETVIYKISFREAPRLVIVEK